MPKPENEISLPWTAARGGLDSHPQARLTKDTNHNYLQKA
jgi:hypothetical protein